MLIFLELGENPSPESFLTTWKSIWAAVAHLSEARSDKSLRALEKYDEDGLSISSLYYRRVVVCVVGDLANMPRELSHVLEKLGIYNDDPWLGTAWKGRDYDGYLPNFTKYVVESYIFEVCVSKILSQF
jgi:hypothetical protein